ncbi:MAG: twin-arginine translocation signal domain-containing protein, partial [Hylemonella sp.]
MQTRRETLKQSAMVAGLMAAGGLLPQQAAAYETAAFQAKTVAEVAKALGAQAPVESKDVTI